MALRLACSGRASCCSEGSSRFYDGSPREKSYLSVHLTMPQNPTPLPALNSHGYSAPTGAKPSTAHQRDSYGSPRGLPAHHGFNFTGSLAPQSTLGFLPPIHRWSDKSPCIGDKGSSGDSSRYH